MEEKFEMAVSIITYPATQCRNFFSTHTRFWLECRWLLLYLLLGQNGVIVHNKDLEQIKALVKMTDKGLFTQ